MRITILIEMNGFASFIMHRSIGIIISLAVFVILTVAILNYSVCANIEATIIQITQEIDAEIIDKGLAFASSEERQAYKDKRLQEELAARGLDVCL
jgi:hypothetical protein